jgi:hypothetical protein
VDPRADVDAVEYTEITYTCRVWNPGHPTSTPSLYSLNYSGSTDCDRIVAVCLFVCFCPVFVLLSFVYRTDSVTGSWILTAERK